MPANLVVPELGESVVEATVGHWRKAEGDRVSAGEAVVELETDKVDLEVGAPRSGVLKTIAREEGVTVRIGDVLGVIEETAESPTADSRKPESPPASSTGTYVSEEPPVHAIAPSAATLRSTPSARRLARERGPDVDKVRSPFAEVPMTSLDAEGYSKAGSARRESPTRSAEAAAPSETSEMTRREERVRMSRRRLTIATRLVEAVHAAAMVTTFNDVDMSSVVALRLRHKDSFKARHGVGLGIVSFFVKASIAALRAFPRLNAEIRGQEIVLKHYYDIGVAVGASEGLVVPVLRDADRMSFGALEQAIKSYARKAEDGSLSMEDLRGGTFTISNGGVFGSLLSTPILNPPQAGILGLHRIEERPVNVAGEVRIRPMMYLALSYDHRIVDGLEAVRFLRQIKELIEEPETLFLEA